MARRSRLVAPEQLGAVLLRSTEARSPMKVDLPPVAPRDWELAVGTKIAYRARPTRLVRGVLYVRTASATWTQELSLLADKIIASLRARGLDVRSLRFQVGACHRPVGRARGAGDALLEHAAACFDLDVVVAGEAVGYSPFGRRNTGPGGEDCCKLVTRVSHWVSP